MKELLYKKSEAVAALNRVDGFHPMELARKIGEEGQEEQLYLDVKYRKLWFRLVNPAGRLSAGLSLSQRTWQLWKHVSIWINVIRKTIM